LVGHALENAVGDELVQSILDVREVAALDDAALDEAGLVE
jgi:hypothetical protein